MGDRKNARIGALRLRVPGRTRAEGQRVANAVAQRLAERTAELVPAPEGHLRIRVSESPELSGRALAEVIATRVVDALRGSPKGES